MVRGSSTTRFRALVVATSLAAAVPAFARPAGAVSPLPSDLKILFRGGGWGHGHGMSQYGARGQAEAGRTYPTILRSYYTGVDVAEGAMETMRVLLDWGGSMTVGGPEGYTAKWSSGGTIRERTDANPYTRVRATDTGVSVYRGPSPTGPWTQVTAGTGRIRFYPDGSVVPLADGSRLEYYRGFLEAYRRNDSTIYAINQLSMDEYLNGVVPREMPASWHRYALRAQSVAARTYASWKKANAPDGQPYDICASTSCQVYAGYGFRSSPSASMTKLENERTNDAIDHTSGITMLDGGDPIFAEFHSSSGGHTSQGSRSYLAPVVDPWDDDYSPHHRWDARIPIADIEEKWPAIGRLAEIDDVERDGDGPWGGRVETLRLVGTDGSVTVSGNTFRSAFSWPGRSEGIRSTLFSIRLYDAAADSPPAEVVLEPGTTGTASVKLRNTGTKAWPVGESVALATSDPKDHASSFRTGAWMSESRPGYLTRDLTDAGDWVSPGEVGEFRFEVRAPSTSGLYIETFRPVVTSTTWFGDEVEVPIRVPFDGSAHLGANLVENAGFEAVQGGLPAGWEPNASGAAAADATRAVDGDGSVKLTGNPAGRVTVSQPVGAGGDAGESIAFSAWSRARGTSAAGGTIDAKLKLRNADGSTTEVEIDFPEEPHDWTYRGKRFDAPKDFDRIDVYLSAREQAGSVWYDRVRVARSEALNAGFEVGGATPSAWELVRAGSGDGRETAAVRSGRAALRLAGARGVNKYARQYVALSGGAGETFRLGGWNRTAGTTASGGPVKMWVRVNHADGSAARHHLTFPGEPHAWRYGEILFTTARPYTRIDLFAKVADQTGTAWFDEVTLGRAPDARSLSANSGFELGLPRAGEWPVASGDASVSADQSANGDSSLHLDADPAANVYAGQHVPLAGDAGDAYGFSAWNRTSASDPAGGPVRAIAKVRYADGTTGEFALEFPRGAHAWQRLETTFSTAKAYDRIDVYVKVEDQTGDAWFDSARLVPLS